MKFEQGVDDETFGTKNRTNLVDLTYCGQGVRTRYQYRSGYINRTQMIRSNIA